MEWKTNGPYTMFTVCKLKYNVDALRQWMCTHTHSYRRTHLIVSIMATSDGKITKALVVKGQILPEDVSSANVKQN